MIESFTKACELGNMKGCFNLGKFYYKGLGVEKSYNKAYDLYDKACKADIQEGCYLLGTMYYHGEGVAQYYSKAIRAIHKGMYGRDIG